MLDVGSVCEKMLYVDRTYIIESYINTLRQAPAQHCTTHERH